MRQQPRYKEGDKAYCVLRHRSGGFEVIPVRVQTRRRLSYRTWSGYRYTAVSLTDSTRWERDIDEERLVTDAEQLRKIVTEEIDYLDFKDVIGVYED